MNEFDELVTEALRALRNADAGVDMGLAAEIRGLLAFRRQQRRHRLQRIAVWSAMAAAALILAVLFRAGRETPPETPKKLVAVQVPAATEPVTAPLPAPPVKQVVRAPAEPEEIATGFFPLMESPPPFERGMLVRMTVRGSTMRAVGLPVGDDHLSDPVQADVLVGQDDLARAIRFVSYRKIAD